MTTIYNQNPKLIVTNNYQQFFCTFWLVFVTFSIFFSFEYHKSLPVWCELWQVWWFSTGESHKRSEASESERFFSSFLYSEASTELFLSSWSWLNEQRWVKIKQQKYDFLMNRKWSCTSSMQMQNEVWVIKSTKTNTRTNVFILMFCLRHTVRMSQI